jgi:hypothetical protein
VTPEISIIIVSWNGREHLDACLLAVAGQGRRELYRMELESHEALVALDLAAELATGALEPHRASGVVMLVCGNGRRDRCCARLGPATYRALLPRLGDAVWLSTHQGGHRYAATGLVLPAGIAYGFLAPEEAEAVAAAWEHGWIHLRCFRGRTFHRAQAQAADSMLREALGEAALDPWRLDEAVEESPAVWRVAFAGGGRRHVVHVRHGSEQALVSCGPAKVKTIDRFELLSIASEEER